MEGFDVIHSYTRAQAISDGVLVDVSQEARALGFKYPVALTGTLNSQYVECPESMQAAGWNTAARLFDLLVSLIKRIKEIHGSTAELHFQFSVDMEESGRTDVPVWACVNGGDSGEPVITIMLEGED